MRAHMIFYVKDQAAATEFFAFVLNMEPQLNVPGMTEFKLSEACILGLMPEVGIKRLLKDTIPDPGDHAGVPRAELYLIVEDAQMVFARALSKGAKELSSVSKRDWGDSVGYCMEENGHILAVAQPF